MTCPSVAASRASHLPHLPMHTRRAATPGPGCPWLTSCSRPLLTRLLGTAGVGPDPRCARPALPAAACGTAVPHGSGGAGVPGDTRQVWGGSRLRTHAPPCVHQGQLLAEDGQRQGCRRAGRTYVAPWQARARLTTHLRAQRCPCLLSPGPLKRPPPAHLPPLQSGRAGAVAPVCRALQHRGAGGAGGRHHRQHGSRGADHHAFVGAR